MTVRKSYRAQRLPVHRGPAGWSAIIKGQSPPVRLEDDRTVDFAIIGAGFAGLSAAARLRELNPDARIVVLEAGRLAEGASGRNSGFMIDLPHDLASDDYSGAGFEKDRKLVALNRRAIGFAGRMVEEFNIDPAFFRRDGKVNGATGTSGDKLNEQYANHLARMGEDAEMLDARSMRELTGSQHYVSGLYTSGTVLLQPAGYIRGLGEGLRSTVDIFEESPVIEFRRDGRCWSIKTSRASVSAGRVILANNGHVESFGVARRRLMHIFLFAVMTPRLGPDQAKAIGGRSCWGITPADPMGTSVRRIPSSQGGDRIVVRTCASFRPGMQSTRHDLDRARKVMSRKFLDRFPQLSGVKFEHSWAGHLCLTRNGVTLIGEIDEGIYTACCQNGLGTVRGTLTGIGAAELASDQASQIGEFFSSEPEPTLLPPAPISTIGANAFLRWREWRASNE